MVLLRTAAAWFAAAMIAAISASLMSTQQVILGLTDVGAQIDFTQRLSMTIDDLLILETLLPVMCACFLVGFVIAALCFKLIGGTRTFWYTLAGACAIVTTLLLMSWVMNLMPVAGARSTAGMILMALSGALGGFIFARLTTPSVN